MSNINFTCPHCSFSKQLPASAEGMQGNCPNCNAVVTIRADAPTNPPVLKQQPTPHQQQRSQQVLGYCPKCGSSTLEVIPDPDSFSRNPEYRCIECRIELRTSKSTWSLLFIAIGGFFGSIVGIAARLDRERGGAWILLCLIGGIWAVFRLRRPKISKAPRRS